MKLKITFNEKTPFNKVMNFRKELIETYDAKIEIVDDSFIIHHFGKQCELNLFDFEKMLPNEFNTILILGIGSNKDNYDKFNELNELFKHLDTKGVRK